ncbi:MAG TPA: metal ABC transporter permease [Rhabdochlamydiaceae bacterium]|nr:metal ABC transporter permease [Rhabdochlamydiaceae bacterium]
MEILKYFTDPVLRAPTIGCMLMCLSSSLVGILVFIRKRSLLGEALSHASYPGVVFSVVLMATFFSISEESMVIGILTGAFISALLGLWVIDLLERKLRIKNDAALCFVLSIFFGVGLLVASRIQTTHTLWYNQIQLFLFGQAATMTDVHIFIYGLLAVFVMVSLCLLYRFIEIIYFDRGYAKTLGIPIAMIDTVLFILLVLSIVIGIRSVGVVLMSAMLISPVVAARQFTHRLKRLFLLSGFLGMAAGFVGNYLSLELSVLISEKGQMKFSLPTGPMIVLTSSFFCLIAILFAPKGLLSRFFRNWKFKQRCMQENLLKSMWREGKGALIHGKALGEKYHLSLWKMERQNLIVRVDKNSYQLTAAGFQRAAHIVRLHRLWEAYLVYMGQGREKVHRSAEEMEHILTPEMEKELSELLHNPKKDPHQQPIPGSES